MGGLYLRMGSRMEIIKKEGKGITLPYLSEVVIKETIKGLGNTATVTVPQSYGMPAIGAGWRRQTLLSQIRVGDRVVVQLGYNEDLAPEFTGYIASIDPGPPVVLRLDDAYWPLKHIDVAKKTWQKVSLAEVIRYLLPEYTVDCPELTLSEWRVHDGSIYAALKAIKEEIGLYTRIDADKKTLSCYYAYAFDAATRHTYRMRRNVKKNGLEYVRKDDVKIRINAVAPTRGGKKIRVSVGDTENDYPRTISRNYTYVDNEEELRKLAEAELERLSYDGYRGSITGFGVPRTHAGDSVEIIDDEDKTKEGVFLIEEVTVRYGLNGWERVNKLSYKTQDK